MNAIAASVIFFLVVCACLATSAYMVTHGHEWIAVVPIVFCFFLRVRVEG